VSRARLFLTALLLSGCAAQSIFYFPNKFLYVDPRLVGVEVEPVTYPSRNGKKLTGFLFRTPGEPLGTVVHFHGNGNNATDHFPLVLFLAKRGFDLLVFDYQGYGLSEGKPTPAGTVEDGLASVQYALDRSRPSSRGVVLLGQSLGAAVAAVVAAEDPRVKGVVLEAGFSTYRSITGRVMRKSVVLWPLSFVFPPLFVRDGYAPVRHVGRIAPRPVLIIHGDGDKVVPVKMAGKLFEAAGEPKSLWIVKGAGHLLCRSVGGKAYEDRVAGFFDEALKRQPT
jgi:uncharacterized protein